MVASLTCANNRYVLRLFSLNHLADPLRDRYEADQGRRHAALSARSQEHKRLHTSSYARWSSLVKNAKARAQILQHLDFVFVVKRENKCDTIEPRKRLRRRENVFKKHDLAFC